MLQIQVQNINCINCGSGCFFFFFFDNTKLEVFVLYGILEFEVLLACLAKVIQAVYHADAFMR